MIHLIISKILTSCINPLLALDESTSKRLESLAGKTLKIIISGFNMEIYLQFSSDALIISPSVAKYDAIPNADADADADADATIVGTFQTLLQAFISMQTKKPQLDKTLTIQGDMEVVQACNQLFSELDIDWEEILSTYCGDVIAHSIGNHLRNIFRTLKRETVTFVTNFGEFLQEEQRLMPPKEEIEDFYSENAHLRDDVERIEARLAKFFTSSSGNARIHNTRVRESIGKEVESL